MIHSLLIEEVDASIEKKFKKMFFAGFVYSNNNHSFLLNKQK